MRSWPDSLGGRRKLAGLDPAKAFRSWKAARRRAHEDVLFTGLDGLLRRKLESRPSES